MSAVLVTRLEPLEHLEAHLDAWHALVSEALEPNPFYAPGFLLAAAKTLEKPGAIKALTVWRGQSLLALLPLHRPNWREGLPFGVISAYWNPYICLTTPLIHAVDARETLKAILAQLDTQTDGLRAINFPALPLHRSFGRLLAQSLVQDERTNIILSHYPRALLAPLPGMHFRDYVEQESAEARKSFRRRETRLLSEGKLEYAVFSAPGALRAKALAQFLALESSGWKGRHRTALASQPQTLAFIEQAFSQENALAYEIERLSLDGLPIAMSLNMISHGIVHTFKQAYDETWRPLAPGKLLDRQAIRRVTDSAAPLTYDSCALPGYPIDAIWHERLVIAHKLVGIGQTTQAHQVEKLAHRAMRIQRFVRRLKRWRKALMGSSAPKNPKD